MRTLHLIRTEAEQSPGRVAEAVVFSDGKAVLHWLTDPGSIEFYASEDEMRAVRERSGRSRFAETGTAPNRAGMLRILREAGPAGLIARDLYARLGEASLAVPRETMHRWLNQLRDAGLVRCEHNKWIAVADLGEKQVS
jgi:DNA-binding transcriptional ArsR family regulator